MERIASDTLNLWQAEGSRLIPQNFEVFRNLVARTRDFVQRGKYNTAAVYAEIAALYATEQHCGLFASPELEQILLTIGQKAIPTDFTLNKNSSFNQAPKNILHVSTAVMGVGGHSRMLWRWIGQDTERSHSLVLTRQGSNEIPQFLSDAVNNSHGRIYALDKSIGNLVSWAKKLREIAASADLVVLHIWSYDVIPTIAFANRKQSPPIIFVDYGDHCFWQGVSISDIVANLRESGMHISQERRGIASDRTVILPIILNPTQRILSRAEAKQQLGFAEDSVVLLSIARSLKYRTIDGVSFADAHVPLLEKSDRAILIVIGPVDTEEWSAAIQRSQGRIIFFGQREDTAVFYQAADIYVDSFPFVSITSLLEAGSYGTPLVSRYPYSNASKILSADAPGLTDNSILVPNLQEYTAVLSRLVEDEEFRLSLGETTRQAIVEKHMGSNWQRCLEDVYFRATIVPRLTITSIPTADRIFVGEPDVFLQKVFSSRDIEIEEIIQSRLRLMPWEHRFSSWVELVKKHGFGRLNVLLPEWFYCHYYRRLQKWRNLLKKRLCQYLPAQTFKPFK
ncbi:glycosyltransferase family 4 protein [Chroococcidiopsis sp. FACHB-1243]|uniref:glycosyltransferase n=1 Tax=Chroococcidiopsis sp. [FACHB-1243] TaxID=2692781 RepID=UPI00178368C5|nr:glycosyltransferase [Chroococcidiopsis sp. [FACHB-1243]]MBD2308315.1 glycosyltransferase family 4 protein [Chroococcidiopsis sp. [FACHB-1243]]